MNKLNNSTLNIKYNFDTKNLKCGVYSSQYFLKTKQILSLQNPIKSVLQFAILNEGQFVVAGISECVQLLKSVLPKKIFKNLKIYGRIDGEVIQGKTGLLYIEGEYKDICIYENIIDGILNARIGVATKAKELINALDNNQEIIYMADRSNDYWNQAGNGLAAYLGGIKKFSTAMNIKYIKQIDNSVQDVGTMPHALIQQFNGSLYDATNAYINTFNNQNVIALLDYKNDVIQSLNEIKPLLNKLYGVRLDTSKSLIDTSLKDKNNAYGVNNELVKITREWLDQNNGQNIKIIVSSGIDTNKIKELNNSAIKPDIFGVGGYFLSSMLNITADLIKLNGKDQAKVGRFCLVDYKKELFLYKI